MAQRSTRSKTIKRILIGLTCLVLIVLGIFIAHARIQTVTDDAQGWRKTKFEVVSRSHHAVEPGSNLAQMRLQYVNERGTPTFIETELQWDQPKIFRAWIQNDSVFQADSPPRPFSWFEKIGIYLLGPIMALMIGAIVITVLGFTVYQELSNSLKKRRHRKVVRS